MSVIALHVILVIFLATLIRSAFGFGEALIAVPLLALRIPIDVAAPLAVLYSITVATIIILQDWKKVHFTSAGWLVLATIFGIPIGLWLLIVVNERDAKILLAIVIAVFSIYSLLNRHRLKLESDSRFWMLMSGFIAGVLGGAYGINGPPLAIYGAARGWSPQHFRATLQGYFLPASLIGMTGYALTGLWVPAVTHYFLISLPLAIVAVFIGRFINHRFSGETFLKYVYGGLIAIAGILLLQAIHG